MMKFMYEMPTQVIVGKGCIKEQGKRLKEYGQKAYIVIGRHSAKKNGSLKDVVEALEAQAINYTIFDEIEENPSLETMERAKDKGLAEGVDFIIGIGGGSPIDAAKGIGVMIANPHLVADTLICGESLNSLPIIAVPTTAGTGTEVTQYAIATDHKAQTKKNIGHKVFPKLALLDASYMMDMPADITIGTAVDALSHLVESYLNVRSNLLSDMCVEKGLELWGQCIDSLLSGYFTYEVRENLLMASTLAGMAIANTGTSLPHGMGYALTYHKGIPHGLANGVLYIHYLRAFKEQSKVNKVSRLLGLDSHEALEKILAILCHTSITFTEEELRGYAVEMCSNKAKLQNHPETIDEEGIYQIYAKSLLGK